MTELEALRAPAPPGLRDVVVTVPKTLWVRWIAEGDLPGDPPAESGLWDFGVGTVLPREAGPGSRVYVVAFGLLRGYAPLLRVASRDDAPGGAFVRGGGAVACTLLDAGGAPQAIRGWRYADPLVDRARLAPFPGWATTGLPGGVRAQVERVLIARQDPAMRGELRRRVLMGAPLF